jgi:hypothetical protein
MQSMCVSSDPIYPILVCKSVQSLLDMQSSLRDPSNAQHVAYELNDFPNQPGENNMTLNYILLCKLSAKIGQKLR